MPLWTGAPEYLVNALQVQQLNAARVVCSYNSFYWSTTKLLNTCGWLSIKQQTVASTVTMAHDIIMTGLPKNIHATLISEYPYRTRRAAGGDIRFDGNFTAPSSALGERTFKNQARKFYNEVPLALRQLDKKKFKKQIRKWVKNNVPVR